MHHLIPCSLQNRVLSCVEGLLILLWSWEDITIIRIILIIEYIAECIIIIRIVIIIKVNILVLALFASIIIFILFTLSLLALISRLRFLPSSLPTFSGLRLNIVINITNDQPHEMANCASCWLIELQGIHSELSLDLRIGV